MISRYQASYDIHQSFEWNYEHGPLMHEIEVPVMPETREKISFLGYTLNSPIGVAAGPLFQSKYIEYYAKLGWDILVYKTVRTQKVPCHSNPNCLYIQDKTEIQEHEIGDAVTVSYDEPGQITDMSITNSFGVPSVDPVIWQDDIAIAQKALAPGQMLIISTMGTPSEDEDIVTNYARAAFMAKEAGAQVIETNYSCPNLKTGEGSIYQDADLSARISEAIKKEIGDIPLIIKMGYISEDAELSKILSANAHHIDAVSAINTLRMKALDTTGGQALPGKGRLHSGVCGSAIRPLAQQMVARIAAINSDLSLGFEIVGVGGAMTPKDVDDFMKKGSTVVMSGTAAMWDPLMAHRYKKEYMS